MNKFKPLMAPKKVYFGESIARMQDFIVRNTFGFLCSMEGSSRTGKRVSKTSCGPKWTRWRGTAGTKRVCPAVPRHDREKHVLKILPNDNIVSSDDTQKLVVSTIEG